MIGVEDRVWDKLLRDEIRRPKSIKRRVNGRSSLLVAAKGSPASHLHPTSIWLKEMSFRRMAVDTVESAFMTTQLGPHVPTRHTVTCSACCRSRKPYSVCSFDNPESLVKFVADSEKPMLPCKHTPYHVVHASPGCPLRLERVECGKEPKLISELRILVQCIRDQQRDRP